MQYSINYKGITLENFDARTDDDAIRFARSRFTHYDALDNDTENKTIDSKTTKDSTK